MRLLRAMGRAMAILTVALLAICAVLGAAVGVWWLLTHYAAMGVAAIIVCVFVLLVVEQY